MRASFDLGIDPRLLWSRIPGASAEDVARWKRRARLVRLVGFVVDFCCEEEKRFVERIGDGLEQEESFVGGERLADFSHDRVSLEVRLVDGLYAFSELFSHARTLFGGRR